MRKLSVLFLVITVLTSSLSFGQAKAPPKAAPTPDENMLDSAEKGLVKVLQVLLAKGGKVNITAKDGRTPLMLATFGGYTDAIKLLLDNGAEIDAKDPKGCTALMFAVQSGSLDATKLLIERGAKLENAVFNDGYTPLLFAVERENKDILKALIDKGANVNVADKSGEAALYKCTSGGKWELVQVLLASKDININVSDKTGRTPLMFAVKDGKKDIVETLLELKADVNAADMEDHTALWWAIETENLELAKIIIAQNPNFKHRTNRKTPLQFAIAKNNGTLGDMLRKAGAQEEYNTEATVAPTPAKPAQQVPMEQDTIFAATERGDKDRIKEFLKERVKINSQDDEGNTPMHIASKYGMTEMVNFLAQNKANTEVFNQQDWTPLMFACDRGYTETVIALLELGADSKARNKMDTTPLMLAVQANHHKTVEALLSRGADPNASRKDGLTAMRIAQNRNYLEIINLLKKAGLRE